MMITAVIISLLFMWLADTLIKILRLPPGPWGLPVVGYLPWMVKTPVHKIFVKLGKKYGGVFSIKMGCQTVVVLNDWPSIKATLVDRPRLFSGRPYMFTLNVGGKNRDIGLTDGIIWRKQRNVTIQCLRNMGMGQMSMENHFQETIDNIVQALHRVDNQTVQMDKMFFDHLLRANCKIVSSQDITSGDSGLSQFEVMVRHIMDGLAITNPVNYLPWLRFFQPKSTGFWKFNHHNEQLWTHLRHNLSHHTADWIEGSESCFIEFYLREISKRQDFQAPFNEDFLLGSIWDIFLAGVDTTNNSLIWGCLFLASYPQVQTKLQQELDLVVGRQRSPQVRDFPQLPYLNAFIKEVHRKSCIAGFALPHCPTSTTQINGYTIPKGTPCIQNIYAVHHDPDLWEEPELFKPERFLDANNKAISPPYLMPFSIGPRQCIGQPLAEMVLRLIFSTLVHQFNFRLPPNQPNPSLEHLCRFIFQANPYSLLIQSRKD